MNWYLQNGKDSDVVLSSKVCLSRNIKGIPFTTKASQEELKKVYSLMKDASNSLGYGLRFFDLSDMDEITRDSLAEKHLISKAHSKSKQKYSAIILNDDESICIEVNEEDHIKIQVFRSGLELESITNLAIELDEKIGKILPYSYHKQYGYLTACPTNVGTGMKVSTIVHLPALSITRNTRKLLNVVNNFGMEIKGLYGDGSKVEGDLYQISNNQTLGVTEKEIVKSLNLITNKVIEQERTARKYLTRQSIDLEDKVYRDFGILTNARKINLNEALKLLSNVKLGVDLGIIKELNDSKVSELMLYIKPANLQKRVGKELTINEQSIERAKIVKEMCN